MALRRRDTMTGEPMIGEYLFLAFWLFLFSFTPALMLLGAAVGAYS